MDISEVVIHQLETLFLLTDKEKDMLRGGVLEGAEKKTVEALRGFSNKYFKGSINPFNGVMYCNFLYRLSHDEYIKGNTTVADKVYSLNKMLHGVDLFYGIDLPVHLSCEHPLGSVMGRAKYGEYFFFYQGCTVGGSWHRGELYYPVIGREVLMYSDSKILGNSHIGDHVILSANAYVINTDIPNDCIVFGQSPNLTIKKVNKL